MYTPISSGSGSVYQLYRSLCSGRHYRILPVRISVSRNDGLRVTPRGERRSYAFLSLLVAIITTCLDPECLTATVSSAGLFAGSVAGDMCIEG